MKKEIEVNGRKITIVVRLPMAVSGGDCRELMVYIDELDDKPVIHNIIDSTDTLKQELIELENELNNMKKEDFFSKEKLILLILLKIGKMYIPNIKPYLTHQLKRSLKPDKFIDYVKKCALNSDITKSNGAKEAINDWLKEQE